MPSLSSDQPVERMPEAVAHLRAADPRMAELIERVGDLNKRVDRRGRPPDAYGALLRSIIGQQLSSKAAYSIYTRFIELFGGRTPTPAELLAEDPDRIRAAGLSRPKVAYMRDLAGKVESGELEIDRMEALPDDEVIREIVAVKGLGQWSADMFLIFHLKRPDVLAVGDLGLRRAAAELYELDEMPDAETFERLGERWRPYRTLACLYLWRSLHNEPVTDGDWNEE